MGKKTGILSVSTTLTDHQRDQKTIAISQFTKASSYRYNQMDHRIEIVEKVFDSTVGELLCLRMKIHEMEWLEIELSAPLLKEIAEIIEKKKDIVEQEYQHRIQTQLFAKKRKETISSRKKEIGQLVIDATSSDYAVMVGSRKVPKVWLSNGQGNRNLLRVENLPVESVPIYCVDCSEIVNVERQSYKAMSLLTTHLFHKIRLAPECEAVYGSGPKWGKRCGTITTQFVERDRNGTSHRQYYCGRHIKAER